jgi:hypothetical protein
VVVPRDRFGRAQVHAVRVRDVNVSRLRPVHGALPVKVEPVSRYGAPGRAAPAPRADLERRVYAIHEPAWRRRESAGPGAQARPEKGQAEQRGMVAAPRVAPPATVRQGPVSHRPPFGPGGVVERQPAPAPPRYEEVHRRSQPTPQAQPRGSTTRERQVTPSREAAPPRTQAPPRQAQPAPGRERATHAAPPPSPAARPRETRPLPGEPAERVYRGHPERPQSRTHPAPRSGGTSQRSQANAQGSQRSNGRERGNPHQGDPGR